jgi:hypothetical protein
MLPPSVVEQFNVSEDIRLSFLPRVIILMVNEERPMRYCMPLDPNPKATIYASAKLM